MKTTFDPFLISEDHSIRSAMQRMSEIGQKALFIVDADKKLLGALGDGDIRKWILSGGSLKENVRHIYTRKPRLVKKGYTLKEARDLMLKTFLVCIPVVDDEMEVIEVLTWNDIFSEKSSVHRGPLGIPVVIMAGGKGTRLDPFTRILPKPLIPIGDKPIIEIIMDKFNEYGIQEFFISVNHKSRMIKSYFEDTSNKYKITYIEETEPLGTVGSLRLLKNKVKDDFLVTNCDIIVESDCAEIVKFHTDNDYDMTIVVSCRHYVIPYGVCEIENGGELKAINEKPGHDLLVNTGMYVMKKKVLRVIPSGKAFDINDMITKAKGMGYRIGVFPISEKSWIDIGQWEEYHKAVSQIGIER